MTTSEDVEMEPNPGEVQRFTVELEFVQCLANPDYLTYLAQDGYFQDEAFVNYLSYLKYWKRPEYSKFIKYPQCLAFLDLLQVKKFRDELVNIPCAKFIQNQEMQLWSQHFRKRANMVNTSAIKKQNDIKDENSMKEDGKAK